MTLSQMVSRARGLSRTSSASHTDDDVTDRINDGMIEFVKRTHGHMKDEYLALSPKFQTETHFAIRVTTDGAEADVAITATARTDATGTQVATDLQTALQAGSFGSMTVAWSTTDWSFTLTDSGAAYITIEAPEGETYADATDMLFAKTGTETGTTWTSNHPQDCTLETSLPSDFDAIEYVEWDNKLLRPATYDLFLSPNSTGTPRWYSVKGDKIRIAPTPDAQKMFHVFYKAKATAFGAFASSFTTDCALNSDYHMAPVYYAAAELASESFEYQTEAVNRQKFMEQVYDYIRDYNNQSPKYKTKDPGFEHMRIQITP